MQDSISPGRLPERTPGEATRQDDIRGFHILVGWYRWNPRSSSSSRSSKPPARALRPSVPSSRNGKENGTASQGLADPADFGSRLVDLRMGDTMRLEVRRPAGPFHVTVTVTGFERPVVVIEELPSATERQRALRAEWLRGAGAHSTTVAQPRRERSR